MAKDAFHPSSILQRGGRGRTAGVLGQGFRSGGLASPCGERGRESVQSPMHMSRQAGVPAPTQAALLPPPPPAAGPYVVDNHGLVGDDVVGLHGRAESALPSRRAAGGTRGLRAGGLRTDGSRRRCATPLPPGGRTLGRPGGSCTAVRARGQSHLPRAQIAGAPRTAAGTGRGLRCVPAGGSPGEGLPGCSKVGCAVCG